MAQPTPLFVGLDVHKDSIAVAHAQGECADPPVFVGAIGPRQADLDNSSGVCRRRRLTSCSRTKPDRAATGCIAT